MTTLSERLLDHRKPFFEIAAERREASAELDKQAATIAELVAALVGFLEQATINATDSYCEWCDVQAETDEYGNVIAALYHKVGCPVREAELALARAQKD